MDIIVTIPKNRIEDVLHEEAYTEKLMAEGQAMEYCWHVSQVPRKIKAGDRVFFIENGWIRSFHMYIGVTQNPTVCMSVGGKMVQREFKGWALLLDPIIYHLAKWIPYKGFQGMRYVDFQDEQLEVLVDKNPILKKKKPVITAVEETDNALAEEHKKDIDRYLKYRRENSLPETMEGYSAWARMESQNV
jgi:hypothetical protein